VIGNKKTEGNTFEVDYFVNPGYSVPDENVMELIYTVSAK
jgi:hypothetical protein